MERITAAMAVACTALIFTGAAPGHARAEAPRFETARAVAVPASEATPRGTRTLALLIALDALRTAPAAPAARRPVLPIGL